MSLEPQRKLKPFTGDLRQTIIDACAEVGGDARRSAPLRWT